jgi:hypothetical protein
MTKIDPKGECIVDVLFWTLVLIANQAFIGWLNTDWLTVLTVALIVKYVGRLRRLS